MKKPSLNCHIKTGDTIKIIAGNNKGIIGKIKFIIFKKSIVFIEGISPRIKLLKKTSQSELTQKELEIPIHFSNVMLWDEKIKSASRIGYKFIEGKKTRYFKKSGNLI